MRVQYALAGQAEKGPQGKKRRTYTAFPVYAPKLRWL